MEQLPTTVIGLIAFITVANVGGLGLVVNYFLKSQKAQTMLYMDYIQNKNANLERVTKNFTQHIAERDAQHARELEERESRLRECLVAR